MKNVLELPWKKKTASLFPVFVLLLLFLSGCDNDDDAVPPPVFEMSTVTTGLPGPMGVEVDSRGNIWVAIPGTANNDGKIIIIDKNGNKYDGIVNLPSRIHPGGTELEGPAHLLLDGATLYVLAANYLYAVDIANHDPSQPPIDATTLTGEDIAAFVLNYPFANNYHDSHPYNMTKGPDGHLYITDAGANAIVHRKSAGDYSILAEIPPIPNPTNMGPPMVESVPTGIVFDGENFLTTTLLGFPFPEGKALVYKVSIQGDVSVYQDGFTCLVDIAKGYGDGHLVLQYATFGASGFNPNTGGLFLIDGSNKTIWKEALNMPVGIKQASADTWYITSMGDGTVLKATYR